MFLEKIISGGQTGADFGALLAARELGLGTGGFAPQGWRTESGPRPYLASFGLHQSSSSGYLQRTRLNVLNSDATMIFGDAMSSGSQRTWSYCVSYSKPVIRIPWRSPEPIPSLGVFRDFLSSVGVFVLNVAGNRESKNPGIERATKDFLIAALSEVK